MKLEHKALPPFSHLLPRILNVGLNSGMRLLSSKGYTLTDITRDRVVSDLFVRGCHKGYDSVQKMIGSIALDIERRVQEKQRELKRARQIRAETTDVEEIILILQDRQLVLRRILDTILFSMVGRQEWVIRRLGEEKLKRIDPSVVRRTLELASARNRENPLRFSLVSDLTTIVHIGDLMEVEWSPEKGKQWRLIEVKEGKVNWRIHEIIEENHTSTPIQKAEEILNTLGPHALRQAERMAKQQIRMGELRQLLSTDRGIDFKTKQEIALSREVVTPENYYKEIKTVVQNATERGIAAESVDGCLHLFAVRDDLLPDKLSVAHSIYHMANPELPCRLLAGDPYEEELNALVSMKAPVVDLVDLTMRSQCGYPLFLLFSPQENTLLDLITGRILLFAQFDIEAFIQMAASKGLQMSPITGKEAKELKGISKEIPGCPDAWGISVQKGDAAPLTLLVGFFSRVYYYFTRPSELQKLARTWPDEESNVKKNDLSESGA